ncbi:MAG: glycosyltransferase [Anaerolineae bacterium]|nr:glycosyltransferase [Anaerolineae bacterium]
MRILMVSHGYPPTLSGVTLVVQKVARNMVGRGHEVAVLTSSDRPETYEGQDHGVRLIRVRGALNPWWKEAPIPVITQPDLEEIVAEVQPDIVHSHDAGFLALQVTRLDDGNSPPRVASCYFVPRFVGRYVSWDGEPHEVVEAAARAYSVWLYNRFDCVVFSTEAHREAWLDDDLTVPTRVISNGIDTTRYCPPDGSPEDVDVRYGLPPHPRVLFVGRLAKDKEIDVLIRGMPRLWKARRAHLLIVGRGEEREELGALAAELGVEQCVHFMGYVPERDLPALYRASDLFSIVSTTEVQSLPTLQAAATGMPIVAADAMALPELVHSGINGYLVPPEDPGAFAEAAAAILSDPALAARMGRESLKIAAPHAEKYTFDAYEDLYLRTVAAHEMERVLEIPG